MLEKWLAFKSIFSFPESVCFREQHSALIIRIHIFTQFIFLCLFVLHYLYYSLSFKLYFFVVKNRQAIIQYQCLVTVYVLLYALWQHLLCCLSFIQNEFSVIEKRGKQYFFCNKETSVLQQ